MLTVQSVNFTSHIIVVHDSQGRERRISILREFDSGNGWPTRGDQLELSPQPMQWRVAKTTNQ